MHGIQINQNEYFSNKEFLEELFEMNEEIEAISELSQIHIKKLGNNKIQDKILEDIKEGFKIRNYNLIMSKLKEIAFYENISEEIERKERELERRALNKQINI